MPDLKDIGGGFQLLDVSEGAGQNTQAGSLLQLQQNQALMPLKAQKLAVETKLKTAELMDLEFERMKNRAAFAKTVGDIRRQEARFQNDQMNQLIELSKTNPEAALVVGQQSFPNADFEMEQGIIKARFPDIQTVVDDNGQPRQQVSEDVIEVVFDPNQLSTEKKLEVEGRYFDRFQSHQVVKAFSNISNQFAIIQSSAQMGTGAADTAIINAFSRMVQGGTGLVTESDVRNAMQTVGLTKQIENRMVQAWLEGGPIFGKEVPGTARQNFVDASRSFYQNRREEALAVGQDFVDKANRQGLDPRNIVAPTGDLSTEDFFKTDADVVGGVRNSLGKGK